MGFLGWLGSKVSGAAHAIGSKVASGASWLGDKVSKVADVVGNVAGKVAPTLAAINPEFGAIAAGVATGAKIAGGIGHGLQRFGNAVGTGDLNGAKGHLENTFDGLKDGAANLSSTYNSVKNLKFA